MNRELTALPTRRFFSITRPIMSVQFKQGKTLATFGLHYKRGEVKTRRDISVI